ncbi:MAG: RNA-binding S4 domain-containing protein [Coprobacillaceae bacterium]
MKQIQIRDEYITLGQFLKYINVVSSGIEAKMMIQDGFIKVNNQIEKRRGRKLYSKDIIEVLDEKYEIT